MIPGTSDYDRLKERCLNLERLIAEKRGWSFRPICHQGSTTDSQAERDEAARNLERAEGELQSLAFQFLYDQCEIVI